ncbi:FecCD family ABC transporter permease [Lactococcus termiticola]|uniref:Iron ABC transporter permease protein n=1 Tax=Lactococcus termiticola TaxID=2169526 RepID=A0A2R5HDW4_9LACT|nr:iron ABC transporter permease [Lactococcus termiticola]GBG96006.1 iron ABC transporter permease protein [Lactococcus termiticola]
MSKRSFTIIFAVNILLILLFGLLYLSLGDKTYGLNELWTNPVVLSLRLPRLLGVVLTAILLSSSGFLVQAMTRNPIAEMSTLGISGGASLALSILLVFGWSTTGWFSSIFASLGAFLSLLLVIAFAAKSRFQPLRLILVGTSIGLFTSSLAASLTFYSHNSQAYFLWVVGSFSGLTMAKLEILSGAVVLLVALILAFQRPLALLSFGDDMATSLGLSVNRLRLLVMALVALASGVSVAAVGVLSFVGLIAPQLAKSLTKAKFGQGLLLSNSIAVLLLILADLLARTLISPYEFPAGALTMLIGAIFFISLVNRQDKRREARK